jgi:hypothetical protein
MMPVMPGYAPPPLQAAPTPWYVWLLGGLGFGSLLAFLSNLLRRRRPQPALELNGSLSGAVQAQPRLGGWTSQPQAQAVPVLGPDGAVHLVPTLGISGGTPALSPPGDPTSGPQPAEAGSGESDKSGSTNNVARLDELASYMRRHVEETREATGTLRRTMEFQQRQYQTALSDFQRKVQEAEKRKPSAVLPRMEIAPESMKMLKSLINPATSTNGQSETLDSGEALRQWFSQAESSLEGLLRAMSCKAEAKKSLQTVSLILSNLVSTSAQQEKFREVNTSSSRFREQVGTSGEELLQLAGFERRETGFVFPSDPPKALDKAEHVRDLLQAALRDCDQRWEQAHVAEPGAIPDSSEAAVRGSGLLTVNGASSVAANGASATMATSTEVQSSQDASAHGSSSSSSKAAPASKPPAPWLSSALQRNLVRRPNSPRTTSESQPTTNGTTAPAHPAESADLEEKQRAPG